MNVEEIVRNKKLDALKALVYSDNETIIAALAARKILDGDYLDNLFADYPRAYARVIRERAKWLVAYYLFKHGKKIIDRDQMYEELYQNSLDLRRLREKENLTYFVVTRDENYDICFIDSIYHLTKANFPLKKATRNRFGYASRLQAEYDMWRYKESIKETVSRGTRDKVKIRGMEILVIDEDDIYK